VPKRLSLPRRFSAATTEAGYDRLRALNARWGLSNNYLLTVLLERLDDYADEEALDAAFAAFVAEYGAPRTDDRS
jgi:DTW domain-containing protein YfiP